MNVAAASPADLEHLGQRLGYPIGPDMRGIKAARDGEIVGAVGYDDWTESSVCMHIWLSDMAILKGGDFLRAAFIYPFVQCDKQIVVGMTPANNDASVRFQRWMGFKEVARVPDGWDMGVDTIITQLRRDECPWIKDAA